MLGPKGKPLARRYYSEKTGRDLADEDIVRGYEIEKNKYVVIEDDELERLAPEKSRDIDLRRFVKAVLSNFRSQPRRAAKRLKRGGGRFVDSLEVQELETSAFLAERQKYTPDQIFDRQWTQEILSESLAEMRKQLAAENRAVSSQIYEAYHGIAPSDGSTPTYASIGRGLGLSEQQVKDHLAYARARGAARAELAGYATSGDAFGERSRVVGYAGVVVR
jgi:hypothetical protein